MSRIGGGEWTHQDKEGWPSTGDKLYTTLDVYLVKIINMINVSMFEIRFFLLNLLTIYLHYIYFIYNILCVFHMMNKNNKNMNNNNNGTRRLVDIFTVLVYLHGKYFGM